MHQGVVEAKPETEQPRRLFSSHQPKMPGALGDCNGWVNAFLPAHLSTPKAASLLLLLAGTVPRRRSSRLGRGLTWSLLGRPNSTGVEDGR